MAERKWFKGDTHLHTLNSDGVLTKGQLVERCKGLGLDFIMITDHNYNSVEQSYYDGELLIIQGQEITGENGHVNIWGAKVPALPPYDLSGKAEYISIINACREAGATVSLNHPFCSNCGFRFDIDDVPCDCVELWNTVQHTDNMFNRDWWERQLLSGRRISAIGGSDYHRNYAGLDILAHPTTFVYAEECTPEAILAAMREGRCFVTNSPRSTQIELTCGSATIGESLPFKQGLEAEITLSRLLPLHTVTVYNNDKIVFSKKYYRGANSLRIYCPVKEKGFLRAEVTYEFKGALKSAYALAEKKFLGSNKTTLPPFIRAFTNPIWIE